MLNTQKYQKMIIAVLFFMSLLSVVCNGNVVHRDDEWLDIFLPSVLRASGEALPRFTYTEVRGRLELGGVGDDNGETPKDLLLVYPSGVTFTDRISKTQTFTANTVSEPKGAEPYYSFTPGCYPGDGVPNVLTVNLVMDRTMGNLSLEEIGSRLAPGVLLMLLQLNIRVQISRVIRGEYDLECSSAPTTFAEFQKWTATKQNDAAYWLLLTNCFGSGGINGVTYIGAACGSNRNVGVAAFSWSVIFHELVHALGSSHSFEHGVGLTGGLMDYGNTLYNGVSQIHPYKRPEICAHLTFMRTRLQCPHFYPQPNVSFCGDGVLDLRIGEECECMNRSVECGACRQCRLIDPEAHCSSEGAFVTKRETTVDITILNDQAPSSPECCLGNRFAPPKTLCGGEQKLLACGARGRCVPTCTLHLFSNNANCGFDDSGCLLGCMWRSRCRFDLTSGDTLVSALPDGTACTLREEGPGLCQQGVCISTQAYDTSSPPPQPTTPRPTTTSPSRSVTGNPTLQPTRPAPNCGVFLRRRQCRLRSGCRWIRKRCTRMA